MNILPMESQLIQILIGNNILLADPSEFKFSYNW